MAKENQISQPLDTKIIKVKGGGDAKAIEEYLIGDDWAYADAIAARRNGQADQLLED